MTTSESVKRPDGVTIIAILQFILGGLGLLGVLMMAVIGFAALWFTTTNTPAWVLLLALTFVGLIFGGLSILAIFAGVGLLRLRNWARWVTIILAILDLPAFPIGTVIGALIIWYLLQDSVAALFQKSAPSAATVPQTAPGASQPNLSAPTALKPPEAPQPVEPVEPVEPVDPNVPPSQ
ncbi:MAG: hypothetical protein ACYC6L_05110 [Anaerolineae bacterium]